MNKFRWVAMSTVFVMLALNSVGFAGAVTTTNKNTVKVPVTSVKKTAASAVKWTLNGKSFQPKIAQNLKGVSLVGTEILDQLGMHWAYDEATKTLSIQENGNVVSLVLGEKTALLNGVAYDVPGALTKVNNKLMVPVRATMELLGLVTDWTSKNQTISLKRTSYVLGTASKGPQKVGSLARLKEIIRAVQGTTNKYSVSYNPLMVKRTGGTMPVMMMDTAAPKAAAPAAKATESTGANITTSSDSDYSKTNVQVDGVDEADVVKTDGQYIYQVNRQRIMIVKANPSDNMSISSIVKFIDSNFNPQEIYVDGNNLTVIGNAWVSEPTPVPTQTPLPKETPAPIEGSSLGAAPISKMAMPVIGVDVPTDVYYPGVISKTVTRSLVFDVSDRQAPKLMRTVELDGDYISSRKINDSVYIVTNKWLDTYQLMNQSISKPLACVLDNNQKTDIGYDQLYYLPETTEMNLLQVAGFRLNAPDQDVSIASYMGAGTTVYASTDHLYVAAQKTQWHPMMFFVRPMMSKMATGFMSPQSETKTNLFKFALDNGKVAFEKQGTVDGTLLNQFSLDESDGNLRVAVTTGNVWDGSSQNHLIVLDEKLQQIGKLEGLAKGERIYSVRFMGKRAYLVTFKKVDPLFVIDLADPKNPTVLGELKIPGFSDYLHPYDENHLIGVGKDAAEADETTNANTGIFPGSNGFAYYKGLKLAVFDVTDVNNPKQMFETGIGDRGTDSEALYNHKAFLFNKDKGILALPVTLLEIKNKTESTPVTQYGEFTFQGAYIYKLDLTNGFQLKGRISHMPENESPTNGGWYDEIRKVDRTLYIGNSIYTLSQGTIQANDWNTMKKIGSVNLP